MYRNKIWTKQNKTKSKQTNKNINLHFYILHAKDSDKKKLKKKIVVSDCIIHTKDANKTKQSKNQQLKHVWM